MTARFVIRPDPAGHSVIDIWTGDVAVVAMAAQSGLPATDAEHIAQLLNQRAAAADRRGVAEPPAAHR
ncbi:MAG: hypothetical protein EPO51_12170 [Phenylobacterium sp.]|uniref:hypothetical protein n=1 Tax=Phenylobacterium sp. TaxID=1871053 RepID=UPI00120C5686|nr:hypothetical protein [Phenylobacterium sp.]TAJ71869.1 MAG: hypothetical protein EPO51_12170 [Phenylobacterium sp.]